MNRNQLPKRMIKRCAYKITNCFHCIYLHLEHYRRPVWITDCLYAVLDEKHYLNLCKEQNVFGLLRSSFSTAILFLHLKLCVCNQVYALQESSLVKVDILLNDKPVSELAFVAHAERAKDKAKQVTSSLKENLPRQQFAIKIQVTLKWKIQITLSRTILVTSLSLNYLQLTFFLITPMFKIERF